MTQDTEVPETQITPEVPAPNADGQLTPEEIADLKHRADVSSQNFERAKKAELELKELKERNGTLETPVLRQEDDEEVTALRKKVNDLEGYVVKQQVTETYPQLKEVWSDFSSFCTQPENAGMSVLTAAKAFLVEKDMLAPKRVGLEKPAGGGKRTPPQAGMTAEDAKKLRETDYRKYRDALSKGLIKFS